MSRRIAVTEYLELDVEENAWHCRSCGVEIGPGDQNYKRGCLVYARDPREVHNPVLKAEHTLSPDPAWVRIVEFYCKGCGTLVETEYLPLGHPITWDIALDTKSLRERLDRGELTVDEGRIG